jgi:hypothetical protein
MSTNVWSPASSRGSGGGGASPLNSWLSTSSVAPVDLSTGGGIVVWDFPADGSLGTDVTLSADGKTFTLANDGIYTIAGEHDFIAGAAASFGYVRAIISGTFDASDALASDGPFATQLPAASFGAGGDTIRVGWGNPAMHFKGGDNFTILAQSNAYVSGTLAYTGSVVVCRIL